MSLAVSVQPIQQHDRWTQRIKFFPVIGQEIIQNPFADPDAHGSRNDLFAMSDHREDILFAKPADGFRQVGLRDRQPVPFLLVAGGNKSVHFFESFKVWVLKDEPCLATLPKPQSFRMPDTFRKWLNGYRDHRAHLSLMHNILLIEEKGVNERTFVGRISVRRIFQVDFPDTRFS